MTSPDPLRVSRRQFLFATAVSPGTLVGLDPALQSPVGMIDTHTHFYDPRRLWGVPWPPKSDALLYRPVLPDEFKRLAQPHGVTGAIVVEASPWVEDNQWVLDLAANDRFVLGLVGSLKPGRFRFAARLKRFSVNPLFRGIRVGVWQKYPLADDPDVVRDLKLLADRDLALDVLTDPDKLGDVAKLAGTIPSLRVIVDHCGSVTIDGRAPPGAWLTGLRSCAPHRNLFMKVSGLVEGTGQSNGRASTDVAFYRPTLDAIWEAFGEDRVVFGSDWPVCERFASYATVVGIVQEYFQQKGRHAAEKYFCLNAVRAYKVTSR